MDFKENYVTQSYLTTACRGKPVTNSTTCIIILSERQSRTPHCNDRCILA